MRSEIGSCDLKKGDQHPLCERQEKFRFIKHHKFKYSVELMCKVLGVSTSAYYNWLKSGPSERWSFNQEVMEVIKDILKTTLRAMGPLG